jgi:hypothetical protein
VLPFDACSRNGDRQKSGGKVDDVLKELTGHLVPNARMVPAGIVAVSRAQEHGYTFSYVT